MTMHHEANEKKSAPKRGSGVRASKRVVVVDADAADTSVQPRLRERRHWLERLSRDERLRHGRFHLEKRGVKTHAMGNMKLVGEALTRSGPYGGRDDFPVMLENAIGKSLLAAYLMTPDLWSAARPACLISASRPAIAPAVLTSSTR